ncbi:MAG: DUF4276 family protein [Magnetococcales bacterium]|nr:DUF4276 family protein [Magnetococcales bacterium]
MTRLLLLVEGQSEEIFVKQTLTPFLAERGVYVQSPIVLWTKRMLSGGGFRGGVSNWNQIRKNLQPLTRDTNAWVTTLLDVHGLPEDFPGYRNAFGSGHPRDKVIALQERFGIEVGHPRFIPFLALHEFEAWLFSSPKTVAEHFGATSLIDKVSKAVQEAGEPELINHGEQTHPKARLQGMGCGYKETSDGPTLMGKIGIPAIRKACPHFSGWLDRLESLGEMA